ncbi:MAG: hypothetical protein PHU80_02255 [Kiritimatiellae bacterium]|nr:hypothetical protein [Kiritimatiellia bacterium]
MNIINILRKLGIIRYGAESAVYRNAKERPLSLQQEGVFNSEKDVINSAPSSGQAKAVK